MTQILRGRRAASAAFLVARGKEIDGMRGFVGGLTAFVLMATGSAAWASGRAGEIHEYCTEAVAIVIGRPASFSPKEPSAEFEVEQWIKQPAGPQPTRMHLSGGPGTFTGQTFHMLASRGRSPQWRDNGGLRPQRGRSTGLR